MGWRGAVRSFAAAARAAERDAQRRHKQALKSQMINESADAVVAWEEYVDKLVSLHTDLVDPINWHQTANRPKPPEPKFQRSHYEIANEALQRFKPSFFHIFQGGSARKRKQLEDALAYAQETDAEEYETAKVDYANAITEWESDTHLASRLLKGEGVAIKEVIDELKSSLAEDLIGKSISFLMSDGFVHAIPEVYTDEIVPKFRRKQLASGKLSQTNMPSAQFNELYQDYVVSVSLKIAGDLFHILPINEIYVTCLTRMLNARTGHQELSPILSVQFVRETMHRLNLARLDPSDSLSNFNHVMEFKKTKGFEPVEPLKPIS